jgi:putative acetyltransferase
MGDFFFRPLTIDDYDAVLALWQGTDGIGLSQADERQAIASYLDRNPGLSFVAQADEQLVGALLCGHDGRRGFIHHLAVRASHQRQGVGQVLVERCVDALRRDGIDKCHLFIYATNADARAFWQHMGWQARDDLMLMSKIIA